MDCSFGRVKDIIERLRAVLKCQKCCQMREEKLMLFYHVCDHFYCVDCVTNDKTCPICKNPIDKLTSVINDKNILSLYQSLAKFELPSKQDVENIYKTYKESKEKSRENSKEGATIENNVQEIPIIKVKRLGLKEKKNNLTPPEKEDTVVVGSDETPKLVNSVDSSSLGKGRKSARVRKGRSAAVVSTPVKRTRSSTPHSKPASKQSSTPHSKPASKQSSTPHSKPASKQSTSPLINSAGSLKGNKSFLKCNINKRNPKGETQLHLACKKSNFSAMADLLAAGANPDAQDNAGWTPLHDSVFSGNMDVIKFLLEHGARVNAPGLENTTALHEAIAKGSVEMVKLLLDYGADVNAMNIFKETPLDLVTKYKLEEMKEVLSKASIHAKKTLIQLEEPEQNLLVHKYNLSVEDEKLVNKFVDKFEGELISSLTLQIAPTHIVVSGDEKVEISWPLISSVPKGCRIVTADWVKDSLLENEPKPAGGYQPSSPSLSGFAKARTNILNQLPKLFSGCHFFFGGNFEQYNVKNITIRKEDLKNLVEKNGGVILKRCPDPECLVLEKTVPFHSPASSSLRETSYFIIYQTEKWDPMPKYNMSHMKTLPVEWLTCCVLKFELIDPKEKSWNKFL